uniref:Putative ovule protein n=1 Tax=Solanum chacoense TaxID=4108 RepID=A0A0V0H4V4_SOLCH
MGVTIASRCYCCEEFEEETIQHLFHTTLTAQKLWKQFASRAGIQQHGCLKQMITRWWEANTPIKLKFIFQAIPSIILWELWKRRNARRHGLDINFIS